MEIAIGDPQRALRVDRDADGRRERGVVRPDVERRRTGLAAATDLFPDRPVRQDPTHAVIARVRDPHRAIFGNRDVVWIGIVHLLMDVAIGAF